MSNALPSKDTFEAILKLSKYGSFWFRLDDITDGTLSSLIPRQNGVSLSSLFDYKINIKQNSNDEKFVGFAKRGSICKSATRVRKNRLKVKGVLYEQL